MKTKVSFHLVQYTRPFEPTAYMNIIVSNDYGRWAKEMVSNGFYFAYAKEVSMKEAADNQWRAEVKIRYYGDDEE